MNTTITSKTCNAWGTYYTVQVGSQETNVAIYKDGRVNVCVMNAAARLQRLPAGKVWDSVADALNSYKSEKTLTAIRMAHADCGPQNGDPFSLFATMGRIFGPTA